MQSNWNEVKYNMMLIRVSGFKGRLWSAIRVLLTGKIPTGSTWAQIDDHIQSYKSSAQKTKPLSYDQLSK